MQFLYKVFGLVLFIVLIIYQVLLIGNIFKMVYHSLKKVKANIFKITFDKNLKRKNTFSKNFTLYFKFFRVIIYDFNGKLDYKKAKVKY